MERRSRSSFKLEVHLARLPHSVRLYDTKAGEAGITYTLELGYQKTLFGKMCNNDVALGIIKYEPVKVGSNLHSSLGTAERLPVSLRHGGVPVRLEHLRSQCSTGGGRQQGEASAFCSWFHARCGSIRVVRWRRGLGIQDLS